MKIKFISSIKKENNTMSNYEKLVKRFGKVNSSIAIKRADGITVKLTHYEHNLAGAQHFTLQFIDPNGRVLRTNWFHENDIINGVCHERPLNVDAVADMFGM
jgi:hypothetical protein